MAFLDEFDKKITNWGRTAVQKTRDMSDSAKASVQLKSMESRKMELYAELGKSFYELHRNVANERENQLISSILAIDAEIRQYQEQLRRNKGVVICRNCGAEISMNSRYCNVCGKELIQETFPSSYSTNANGATNDHADIVRDGTSQKEKKKCSNCGAALEVDESFCPECGTAVLKFDILEKKIQKSEDQTVMSGWEESNLNQFSSEEVSKRKCPNCGTILEDDQLFCMQCGTKIE